MMKRNVSMGLGIFLLAMHVLAQTTAPKPPPRALVTFYSNGNFLKAVIPGYKHGEFTGRILDEYDNLAMLRLGQFITFSLDPGPHTFTANAWFDPHPEGGGHLTIDLVANKHYFIGAYLETTPLLVISTFRLEQRTCQQAQQDNTHTKPLIPRHPKKYAAAHLVLESSFPQCP
jgi:hypothetical protein